MSFVYDIITKRDGGKLSKAAIDRFIKGVTDRTIPDYQISAMLMAICINGLTPEETDNLTLAMTHSGEVFDLSAIDGIKVDKHSTGGVADTTTLVLAPLTAALGLPVVKMSGRGLGHTGGTLDKLESIPGFNINLTRQQAIEQVKKHSIVLMGQTESLAPADKYLYSLRDVTGTVESLPLIASSIMSKKLAAGADAIVLDVKYGNGAFMKTPDSAKALADTMCSIGKRLGVRVKALITNMDQPLGNNIGNALEVIEAAEILKGKQDGDLKRVALALGAQMLICGDICENTSDAYRLMDSCIASGKALDKFAELIELQGGNPQVLYDYSLLPQPKCSLTVKAGESGYISHIDTVAIGRASVATGAGRLTKADTLDYSAGIVMNKRLGDRVEISDTLATVYSSTQSRCNEAKELILSAVTIGDMPDIPKLILDNETE
jgi:pyrimidine-nucleoside phosphorylase